MSQRRYRNWNPPLLGNLPDDFLRILPQQLDSIQVTGDAPTCLYIISAHPHCLWQFHFLVFKPRLSYFCCLGFVGKMLNWKPHFLSGPGGFLFHLGKVTG